MEHSERHSTDELCNDSQITSENDDFDIDFTAISNGQNKNLNLIDKHGNTVLITAVSKFNDCNFISKILSTLLENGCKIDAKNIDGDTALHIAAKQGNLEICKILVQNGSYIDEKNNLGETAFMCAIQRSSAILLKSTIYNFMLLKADINVENKNKETALHIAVNDKKYELCKILLKFGAKTTTINKDGDTAMHMAAKHGKYDICSIFIESSECDINCKNYEGDSILHIAARQGNSVACEFLVENFASPDNENNNGDTPLISTAHSSLKTSVSSINEIISALLRFGANINARNNLGNSALHVAAKRGHVFACQVLIMNEANIDIKNTAGDTALMYSLFPSLNTEFISSILLSNTNINEQNINGNTALHVAAIQENLTAYNFLIQNAANFNIQNNDGDTALHIVVKKEKFKFCEFLEFLVWNPIDITLQNKYGDTPLHIAIRKNLFDIFKILVQYSKGLNTKNNDGNTALHVAVMDENAEECKTAESNDNTNKSMDSSLKNKFVQILLQNGANANEINNKGDTALHIAIKYQQLDIWQVLIYNAKGVNFKNEDGNTALHIAAKEGNALACQILVYNNFSVNIKNNDGLTPLELTNDEECINILKSASR